jgi:hypothetical protein
MSTKEVTQASQCAHDHSFGSTAGINYVGQGPNELNGCHRDALNLRHYALQSGYAVEDIIMLLDCEGYAHPTAENMRKCFQ